MIPRLAEHNDCTRCMACYNACPKQAIDFIEDKEGFVQPCINGEKCIGCKLCEKSCPEISPLDLKKPFQPKIYAAWHKEDRCLSSSGGAFSAFARQTIESGGVVFGAAFDENHHLRHTAAKDVEGLSALRGSKYIQSNIGYTFRSVKDYLKDGVNVFFCGTPCQVAGLRSFLNKQYPNLLTADLVCHGVPSDCIFQCYLRKLARKLHFDSSNLHIDNYEFRRREGWGFAPAISASNSIKYLYGVDALYMEAFEKGSIFRESCYHCQYASVHNRVGDLTLADFWGIGRHGIPFKHDVMKGVSLIIANNERGIEAIFKLKEDVFLEERSLDEALCENSNLNCASKKHSERDNIIADFLDDSLSLDDIDRKYSLVNRSLKATVKRWSMKTGIFDIVKRVYNFIKTL